MKSRAHNTEHRAAPTAVAAALLFALAPVAGAAQGVPIPPPATASVIDAASAPGALATVTRAASESKTLHVIVGHSIFIDTEARLRRVYVADPAVLNSVTLTPNEIIVTAMSPGISSLTLLDENGRAVSYVVSSDIDIDGLRSAMAQEMHGNSVTVEGAGGRITLSGVVASDAMIDSAGKLASLYSKDVANALTVRPVHPKQVRLEVRILEVDRTKLQQYGINLFNPGGNTSFLASTTTSQFPSTSTLAASTGSNIGQLTTSNPLNFLLYSSKINLGATIQDLENKQVLQILAEPTITTLSGQKADFLSGGEFPFPIVQPGGAGTSPVVTISFRPYGVKVEFTPVVNDDGTIRLTVAPEVSALDYSNSVTISGFTVPALSTRRAATEVELRSRQSFAISGLLDQRVTDLFDKTPGIASVPILGALFRSKNTNHSTTELIVVVTPTVVDPLTDTSLPQEPELPIHPLNTDAFDKSLGKNHSVQPAAPPIDPDDKAPYGSPAPPPPAAQAPASVPAALNTAPAKPEPGAVRPVEAKPATAAAQAASTAGPATAPGAAPAAAMRKAPVASAATTAAPATSAAAHPIEMVEIMTLSHESDADAMVAALSRRGYKVAVTRDVQDSLLHLDVGPFRSAGEAETMRQRLLTDGYDATIKPAAN